MCNPQDKPEQLINASLYHKPSISDYQLFNHLVRNISYVLKCTALVVLFPCTNLTISRPEARSVMFKHDFISTLTIKPNAPPSYLEPVNKSVAFQPVTVR